MDEFKFTHFLSPAKIARWRWTLWRSQWWSREALEAFQWRLFRQQLDHCFASVPYYQALFRDLGLRPEHVRSREDLRLIPVMTKETVRANHDALRATDFEKHFPTAHGSSGTTGDPVRVYWDHHHYAMEITTVWRLFSWSGYRLGEPFLDLRRQSLRGHRWNWKCRGLELSADFLDVERGAEYATLLRRHGIRLWRGCPAGILMMSEALKRAGAGDLKPAYVYSISENLRDDDRAAISAWTGKPVHDHYAHQEHAICIAQCASGGYHIMDEYGLVEILRDDGSPAAPGEDGRLVGTQLHERSFPLLRYDARDYAIRSNRTCPCGRGLSMVERFTGRSRCCGA